MAEVPHHFLSLSGAFAENLARGETVVRGWLAGVNDAPRREESLAELKIALQCGGSDAFSGVSGNPLAAWVAREVIRYGGAANLAETDELIGAEPYVLQKVKDVTTAKRFLEIVERFKARVAWHGATAEGNPSGGNKFRGLYNITLKSIGAAMKRNPEVRLDHVIEYGQPMTAPGFSFMDSPGNDLESIAGQVASGCNMIFFVTGNGSITNFPFVPTLKIVTTSQRFELLSKEMDVNAGAYLDGSPLESLGATTLDLTAAIAGGQRSAGEQAGHSQVQIWRNWSQTDAAHLPNLLQQPTPTGEPLSLSAHPAPPLLPPLTYPVVGHGERWATERVGLILPTSLCAGQVARLAVERLNRQKLSGPHLSRFVTLVHTEGCGVSGGAAEALYVRTLLGYLTHPLVGPTLLLEHGCEKTHNDYMRHRMREAGLDPEQFGWASIQLDGGIDPVLAGIEGWFCQAIQSAPGLEQKQAGPGQLRLGVLSAGPLPDGVAPALAAITKAVVGSGGTVVVPEGDALLAWPDNPCRESETSAP